MGERNIEYWHSLENNINDSWRKRLGQFLRKVADSFDGRQTLAIQMVSMPPLGDDEEKEVIKYGLHQMYSAQEKAVKIEALESGMRELNPDLYEESGE